MIMLTCAILRTVHFHLAVRSVAGHLQGISLAHHWKLTQHPGSLEVCLSKHKWFSKPEGSFTLKHQQVVGLQNCLKWLELEHLQSTLQI